jgi:D-3-phosphoglycerate dehydrogenase / 2-oxoglutarate reductase
LKVIGRAGIGVDNVDIPAASKRGVIVMNTPFGNSVTTAEHAIALMFAVARQIPEANASTHAGKVGEEPLHGRGIVQQNPGRNRRRQHRLIVCDRALGLKMKVLAYDPFLGEERAKALGVQKVELDELLARADFITLHVPLTDKTRNILSAENLAKTKKGVRIINCARGGLVDEAALAEAIKPAMSPAPASTSSPSNPPPKARSSTCPMSSAPRIWAPRPPRRRKTSPSRWPSRWRTTC